MSGSRTPDPAGLQAWMAMHHDPKWKPTKTRRIIARHKKPFKTSLPVGEWLVPGVGKVHVSHDHDGEKSVTVVSGG